MPTYPCFSALESSISWGWSIFRSSTQLLTDQAVDKGGKSWVANLSQAAPAPLPWKAAYLRWGEYLQIANTASFCRLSCGYKRKTGLPTYPSLLLLPCLGKQCSGHIFKSITQFSLADHAVNTGRKARKELLFLLVANPVA